MVFLLSREALIPYLESPFFFLSKPSILIHRVGLLTLSISPFLFRIAQGFPSHTSSFFFCHFHFTECREDFGLGKERNQNKNRTTGRNAKTEAAVLGILWVFFFFNGKTFHFETNQTSILFLASEH